MTFSDKKFTLEQLNRFEKAIDLIANEKDEKKKDSYIKLARKILTNIRIKIDPDMEVILGMIMEEVTR